MADDSIAAKPHPNKGRKHSPEHIAKRVAAIAATKADWTEEQRASYAEKVRAQNPMASAEARAKSSASHKGKVPWNKGNNWRSGLSDEEIRARNRVRAAKRRAKSGRVKMNDRFSALIRHHLKIRSVSKNRTPWPKLVGYGPDELEAHLRSTIPDGFSWDDYVSGDLHIDHIVPVAAFNFTSATDVDFARCWALSNLRLLEKFENLRKGARLSQPFQPSLAL